MRIIRHELAITDYQEIRLPNAGQLLSVAQSRTSPNTAIDLWSVDHEQGNPGTRAIHIIGTGNPMPDDLAAQLVPTYSDGCETVYPMFAHNFLGTVVTPSGLVWHVIEGPIRTQEGH